MNFGITDLGGVSSSDLPISNVVYPSWDDGDSSQNYILMASYSWAQDATRMASLVKDYPDAEVKDIHDPLVTLCLQNLVKLFQANGHTDVTYDYLRKKYISHHAWSWSHDPWTAGAFALFGPGQFSNIYQSFFTEPLCGGKLLIAGEALSVHHAWISGAIDSAFIKVTQLAMAKRGKYGAAKMKKSVYGGGVGEMPHELDETLLYWSVELNKKTLEKKGVS
jgi:monoamine oxidase